MNGKDVSSLFSYYYRSFRGDRNFFISALNSASRIFLVLCLAFLSAGCSIQKHGDKTAATGTKNKMGVPDLLAPRPGQIRKLPDIELVLTPQIEQLIDYYRREQYTVQEGINNRRKYERMLNEVFRDEGVPPTLINLALIESRFEPEKESRAGAVGMWQFMSDTGRLYGLQVGWFEDQRKDPILSSIAAARHLYDLYLKYNDWYLAVAAYNRGTAGIDAAMKKSGAATFFELVRTGAICDESARFVYRFVALCFIMNDLERYGFASSRGRMASGASNRARY